MLSVRTTQSNPNWLTAVVRRLQRLSTEEVAVGFPKGEDGISSPYYPNGASILNVAIWNNFGMGVPRRPFFDNAVIEMRKEAAAVVRAAVSRFPEEPERALALIGEWAKAKIQTSIRNTVEPPNTAMTVARKRSSHPLIDTGALIQHVTYAVRRS